MDQNEYHKAYNMFKESLKIRAEIFSEFNSYLADTNLNLAQALILLKNELGGEDQILEKIPDETLTHEKYFQKAETIYQLIYGKMH